MANPKTTSSWFDNSTNVPLIPKKPGNWNHSSAAIADGKIDDSEITAQEARLVHLDEGNRAAFGRFAARQSHQFTL